jgi:hypothetical protein
MTARRLFDRLMDWAFGPIVYKTSMGGAWCIHLKLLDAIEDVKGFVEAGDGEDFKIQALRMTKKEIAALPEFEGW